MLRLNNRRASLLARGCGVVAFASRNIRSILIHGSYMSTLKDSKWICSLHLESSEVEPPGFLKASQAHHALDSCPATDM